MKKATALLIIINASAYAALASLSNSYHIDRYYIDIYGLNRGVLINQHYYWQVLTSFFMHFNITHLSYNMLFLAAFGYLCENLYGWKKTLLIYLLSGLVVSIIALTVYPHAVFGGASGAVLGLIGALLRHSKSRKPAQTAIMILFLLVTVREVYIAHLTGLLTGLAVATLLTKAS